MHGEDKKSTGICIIGQGYAGKSKLTEAIANHYNLGKEDIKFEESDNGTQTISVESTSKTFIVVESVDERMSRATRFVNMCQLVDEKRCFIQEEPTGPIFIPNKGKGRNKGRDNRWWDRR